MTAIATPRERKQEHDTRRALEEVAMGLAANLERLEEARNSFEGIDEAISNLRYSVAEAERLRDQVLTEHEYNHPGSARFCRSQACKMAAGEW